MGMTEPVQGACWLSRLMQVRRNSRLGLNTAGIQSRPARRQITIRRQMQFQGRRQQRALRIQISRLRLKIQMAAD